MQNSNVFVYGTLRRGFTYHHLLSGSPFLGDGRTADRYSLWMNEYPCVCRHPSLTRIHGELYRVTPAILALLDELEDHPRLYRREATAIVLNEHEAVRAWMYFFPKPQGIAIPSGDFADWG
ncbi:gamma-glutamylcyclotransferase family protein [Desulfonatronum thioautotrophicum]|uniref:gamma-glutamylcyclotransferase family protein n=1 Tax=Desulfonatronum thioautotrophicum TaxID=617001 RepID=UPI0005EBB974|nr:gamma-glutamylcyclotransferase family protein [Desulfonatronum thioautotrophicum]